MPLRFLLINKNSNTFFPGRYKSHYAEQGFGPCSLAAKLAPTSSVPVFSSCCHFYGCLVSTCLSPFHPHLMSPKALYTCGVYTYVGKTPFTLKKKDAVDSTGFFALDILI